MLCFWAPSCCRAAGVLIRHACGTPPQRAWRRLRGQSRRVRCWCSRSRTCSPSRSERFWTRRSWRTSSSLPRGDGRTRSWSAWPSSWRPPTSVSRPSAGPERLSSSRSRESCGWGIAARRFSVLAGGSFLLVAASALVRLPSSGVLFTSAYGVLIVLKIVALLVLGVLGWWHRRRTLPVLETPGASGCSFA
ncbi:CopD family protein [Streptomyces sp. NPDC056470]|uniref:CopD family protein n=1 Tax=Streptomyces sp. NPDC056470 TaxID=3345831 RepID=UPI00369160FF